MINLNDLRIDNSCFGKHKILADVKPYYSYGSDSKDLDGYKYKIVFPSLKMESVDVKIPGAKQIELKGDDFPYVELEGLEVKVYVIEGKPIITATAKNIHIINPTFLEKEYT